MTAINRGTADLSRRQFIVTSLTAAGGFALGISAPGLAEAATLGVRPWGDEADSYRRRDQCLDRDRARRYRHHPLRPRRNGAGQLYGAAA